MTKLLLLVGIAGLAVGLLILHRLKGFDMATIDERFQNLETSADNIATGLAEGFAEVTSELQKLRNSTGTLSPEQEARLDRIQNKLDTMASTTEQLRNTSPSVSENPPAPAPEPAPSPDQPV